MSFEPLLWAMKHAPVADTEEWAVLVSLAEKADEDGCNAFPAAATIAKRTHMHVRTVARRIGDLERRGLIRRGDQAIIAARAPNIPANQRPVNWDVQVPFAAYSEMAQATVNEYRREHGLPPLTHANRPLPGLAPEKPKRSDKGSSRKEVTERDSAESHDYESDLTASQGVPGGITESDSHDSQSIEVGLPVTGGMTTSHTTFSSTHPTDPPRTTTSSAADAADDDEVAVASDKERTRLDVERVCIHLADRVEANGSKRPTITENWRKAARLLMDADGRSEAQVHNMIDWCQDESFWRAQVMSMVKLRAKYDQLRLVALAAEEKRLAAGGTPRGRRVYSDDHWRTQAAEPQAPESDEEIDRVFGRRRA